MTALWCLLSFVIGFGLCDAMSRNKYARLKAFAIDRLSTIVTPHSNIDRVNNFLSTGVHHIKDNF